MSDSQAAATKSASLNSDTTAVHRAYHLISQLRQPTASQAIPPARDAGFATTARADELPHQLFGKRAAVG